MTRDETVKMMLAQAEALVERFDKPDVVWKLEPIPNKPENVEATSYVANLQDPFAIATAIRMEDATGHVGYDGAVVGGTNICRLLPAQAERLWKRASSAAARKE